MDASGDEGHGLPQQAVWGDPNVEREPAMRPGSVPPPGPSDLAGTVVAVDDPVEVVALGAWCDVVTEDEHRDELIAKGITGQLFDEEMHHARGRASFDVSEFAVLADGRCLTLHAGERGFDSWSSTGDPWAHASVESVEADVLNTVLPDDDDTDDEHPWEWLVELLGTHGVRTSVDHLRSVPHVVELSDRLVARLNPSGD